MNHADEMARMAADTKLSAPRREAAQWALQRLAEPPAVQVKPLVWDDFHRRGAKAQAWNDANYMIQKWSDGRWEISASYPGYSTFIEGADRFYPTIKAAKAAAQADYEACILAAIDARPASVVRDDAHDRQTEGWLIHKAGRGWYRPKAQGYTAQPSEAGRYSYDEAMSYAHPNGPKGPRDGITIKHESDLEPKRTPTLSEALALPEVAALVEAATDAAEAIDMAYGSGDDEKPHRYSVQLRAAIRAMKGEGK